MSVPEEQMELPDVPPAPKAIPAQTIKAVVVPLDLFNRIHDLVREAPHRHADPLLKEMGSLQIHDVNVGPRTAQ